MSTALRITLTPELKQILSDLQQVYPALNEVELVKMAVTGFYSTTFSANKNTSDKKIVPNSIRTIFNKLNQNDQDSNLEGKNFEKWWSTFKKDLRAKS